MNIQIFGNKKSFDSKKAERWFKERRIKFQYIDLPRYGMSAGEYRSVKQKLGFAALIDTDCRAYEELYVAYLTPEAQEEKLLENPELFRTPIVRNGKLCTVGYCAETWEQWLKEDKK
jgi:arsenate reductase-like glutaredoxin family protein